MIIRDPSLIGGIHFYFVFLFEYWLIVRNENNIYRCCPRLSSCSKSVHSLEISKLCFLNFTFFFIFDLLFFFLKNRILSSVCHLAPLLSLASIRYLGIKDDQQYFRKSVFSYSFVWFRNWCEDKEYKDVCCI